MENDGNMEFAHVEEKGIGLNIVQSKRGTIMHIKDMEGKEVENER